MQSKVLAGDFSQDAFVWWFAFHQVHDMPERLIEGREHIYLEWFWDNLLFDQDAMTEQDRAVYANAYNTLEALKAGNRWYKAYPQDLADNANFPDKINVPSLGIAGLGYGLITMFMDSRIEAPHYLQLEAVGHYTAEEAPVEVTKAILDFVSQVENR